MKELFSIILLLITSLHLNGQQLPSLSIQVCEESSSIPLSDVTITSFDQTGEFVSYVMTDGNGCAIIEGNDGFIICSYIGYKDLKVNLSTLNPKSKNTLFLESSSITLKEVIVKAPPIRAKNDTIIYLVDAFKSTHDRHLVDVLKKLPGISVRENGSILYQGQPISKFYIEGQDLLGNSYNQASENLPIEAVSNVEVLENNQNIKILKDKVFEDKAAINIKLKNNYRQKPFGEFQLGAGTQKGDNPFIWNENLFLTKVGTNFQSMILAKTNNTGESLSNNQQEIVDVSDMEIYQPLPEVFINTHIISNNPLAPHRWLNNKSYYGGVNNLVKISENSNLRINLISDMDFNTHQSMSEFSYGGSYNISYTDAYNFKARNFSFKPVIQYELNDNKIFINNELKYSLSNNKLKTNIESNNKYIEQYTKSEPNWIQNKFKSAFYIKDYLLNIISFTRYYNVSQHLSVDQVYPVYKHKSIVTNNNITSSTNLLGNNFEFGIGISFSNNQYFSNSNTSYSKLNFYIPLRYFVRYSSHGFISLSCPIYFNHYNLKENLSSDKLSIFTLYPHVSIQQNLSKYLTLRLSGSYSKGENSSAFYSSDTIREDYRIYYKSLNSISFNSSYRASIHLDYHNLLHMFFSSFTMTFLNRNHGDYRNIDYFPNYTYINIIEGKNNQQSLLSNLSIDKSFSDIGLSIKTEIDYNLITYLIAQNKLLTKNTSNTLSSSLNLLFQKFKWLSIILEGKYSVNWQKSKNNDIHFLNSYNSNLKILVSPINNWQLNLTLENYSNELQYKQYKHSTFLDCDITYKFSKRFLIEGTFRNIFNNSTYSYFIHNGVNQIYTELPLRGREVLLKFIMKF